MKLSSLMKMVILFWLVTMNEDFLRLPGCINMKAGITSLIQPEIPIVSVMQLGIVHMARLYTWVDYETRLWAGLPIILFVSLKGSGICFIIIVVLAKASHIYGV